MRLFHFCHTYITQTETFLYRFVEKSREGADVSLFTFNLANIQQFYPHGTGNLGLTHLAPFKWSVHSAGDLLRYARLLASGANWQRQLQAAFVKAQPDLVHCHFGQMGVMFMQFLEKTGLQARFVISFYGADASVALSRDPEYAGQLPRLWKAASGFLVEGPALGQKLAQLGAPADKIHLCPLIVPIRDYAFKPPMADLKREIRFLVIGRFVEKKGFHLFFDCLGRIKDQLPPFSVTVIGGGSWKSAYQEIIKRHGYEERVHFLGFRPHAECLASMAQHDVLIQPSFTSREGDSEGGAPTILIEAQAIGIPIIASTHADIPFVMGYPELQMAEGQPESLIEILLSLPRRTDLPGLVLRGRRKVEQQHDATNSPSPYRPFAAASSTPGSA